MRCDPVGRRPSHSAEVWAHGCSNRRGVRSRGSATRSVQHAVCSYQARVLHCFSSQSRCTPVDLTCKETTRVRQARWRMYAFCHATQSVMHLYILPFRLLHTAAGALYETNLVVGTVMQPFPLPNDLCCGLMTTTCHATAGEGPFPGGVTMPGDHLRNVFYRMGFNDQEIVALSGGYTQP